MPDALLQASRAVDMLALRQGQVHAQQDRVACEVPVALEFNGIAHAVMMATPSDLEDFASGFALTEGIVDTLAQVHDVDVTTTAEGCTVHLHIAGACFARLKDQRRALTGRTGCGICGTESLAHARRMPAPLQHTPSFTAQAIAQAVASMRQHQPLLGVTGATHAAAWCLPDGRIALIREDVGRHNAMDKLVGALVRGGHAASTGFMAISSRASYEMVQKAAIAQVATLVAVSGVTGLALDVAQHAGITLLGFAREQAVNVYTHPARFILE
jgi:FdhD protein